MQAFLLQMSTSLKIFLSIVLLLVISGLVLSPSIAESNLQEDIFILKARSMPRFLIMDITAYSSSPGETDANPWLTAMNTVPRFGIVATNDLPFGTKIKIPEIFGDQVFVVEDRMNRRFKNRIDVWFPNKAQALRFGFWDDVLVEVLE